MKLHAFAAALVLGAFSMPAMAAGPVDGSWDVVAETPMGAFKSVFTFTPAGDAYTIAIEDIPPEGGAPAGAPAGPPPEGTVSEVVVDGSAFSFKRELQLPQGAMTLTYSGTVDGDALSGEAKTDFGNIPITGTRKAG